MRSINLSLVLRTVFITFPIIMLMGVLSACTDYQDGSRNIADFQGHKKTVFVQSDTTEPSATDASIATENSADSNITETPGTPVVTHGKDAGSAADSTKTTEDASSPTKSSVTATNTYATMEYGYTITYPDGWKMKEIEEGVILSTEKVIDEETEKAPEKVEVKFSYIWMPKGKKFGVWVNSLPKGDETHSFNGKEYKFIAVDSEGPFTRTYYHNAYSNGILKIELSYVPAYTIPLETDSAEWKDYIEAQQKYRKEIIEDFIQIIDSIENDV